VQLSLGRNQSIRIRGIATAPATEYEQAPQEFNTEEYNGITENIFHEALSNPLSTFSIDVDALRTATSGASSTAASNHERRRAH